MEDSVITIVAIFIAAILMFIFPLMSVSDRLDDITQLTVQSETTKFVDSVRQKGVITSDEYLKFISAVSLGGRTSFDIDIEIKVLDENPNIKATQSEKTKIGENLYYNLYTSQIESKLGKEEKIILKEGDIVSVSVKNRNKTLAQLLRNMFFHVTDQTYQIAASHAGVVTIDGY